MIPILETDRLRLRGHELRDFDAFAAMWGDANVTRFIGGKPSPREDSWRRLLTYAGHWRLLGYGFWLIEEKDTGAFVGDGGFANFKRELMPRFESPEMGWALASAMHGKGYASEAIAAMTAWGEKHFSRSDFVCMISPGNGPSLALAGKLGFREYERTTYKGEPTILLRRT